MESKKTKNLLTVKVESNLDKPMEMKILAESIKSVADNFSKALGSGLTLRAIAVLINDMMPTKDKVPVGDIKNILMYASNLRKHVTK